LESKNRMKIFFSIFRWNILPHRKCTFVEKKQD
jgi:hypothetical protein